MERPLFCKQLLRMKRGSFNGQIRLAFVNSMKKQVFLTVLKSSPAFPDLKFPKKRSNQLLGIQIYLQTTTVTALGHKTAYELRRRGQNFFLLMVLLNLETQHSGVILKKKAWRTKRSQNVKPERQIFPIIS